LAAVVEGLGAAGARPGYLKAAIFFAAAPVSVPADYGMGP